MKKLIYSNNYYLKIRKLAILNFKITHYTIQSSSVPKKGHDMK